MASSLNRSDSSTTGYTDASTKVGSQTAGKFEHGGERGPTNNLPLIIEDDETGDEAAKALKGQDLEFTPEEGIPFPSLLRVIEKMELR